MTIKITDLDAAFSDDQGLGDEELRARLDELQSGFRVREAEAMSKLCEVRRGICFERPLKDIEERFAEASRNLFSLVPERPFYEPPPFGALAGLSIGEQYGIGIKPPQVTSGGLSNFNTTEGNKDNE
jgi:hypothetical protein